MTIEAETTGLEEGGVWKERQLRCLRCGEVFPETQLGAHRRAHGNLGVLRVDWASLGTDVDATT